MWWRRRQEWWVVAKQAGDLKRHLNTEASETHGLDSS